MSLKNFSLYLIALSFFLVGCTSSDYYPPPKATPPPPTVGGVPPEDTEPEYTHPGVPATVGGVPPGVTVPKGGSVVEVFYGTNRNLLMSSSEKVEFGSERSTIVSYGRCFITVPPGHELGETNRPWFSWMDEDPEDHMVFAYHAPLESFSSFVARVKSKPGKKMFVFIHGYNVTFEDAAFRTAQMAEDLSFDGAPIFFSWPANGWFLDYISDGNNVEWTVPYIQSFLEGLILDVPGKDIYVIAHSMGGRGTSRAIKELFEKNPAYASRIKELILAAPDIDTQIFSEQIMKVIGGTDMPITLYTSDQDKALMMSKLFNHYVRLGSGFISGKNLEVIDASETDMDFLGHSYFAENMPLLNDMFSLINNGIRADNRFMLRQVETGDGNYWKLTP